MARTALTVQTISNSGIAPSFTAAETDGNWLVNNGREFLEVKNTGDEITVTIQTPATIENVAIAEVAVTIPATTGDKMIGPFATHVFNQADGTVYVDYSGVTNVTAAAFTLP